MLRKYFCIKNLCRHVIENRTRNLRASKRAKECQLNRAKSQEVKDNPYKLSKKLTVKAPSIATFLVTNRGSRSDAAQRQIFSNCHYTEKGALTREGLYSLVSIDSDLDITVEKISWLDGCSCDA